MENLKYSLKKIIGGGFVIMMITIILMVMLFANLSLYIRAQAFMLSTPVCMIIALLLILLLITIYIKQHKRTTVISRLSNPKFIIIATLILMALQIFVCWNAFFMTGWDPAVLLNNSYNIANDYTNFLDHTYFSRYPNNLFLTFIFTQIFKFAKFIGINSIEGGTFIIVILQCIISSLSGLFTFYATKNISNSSCTAWCSYFIYVALVGTSPWVMVPYSDSFTLIFPIFTVWVYTTLKNESHTYLKWITIILTAFVGYKLKPQTIIVLIAILIVHALYHKISKSGLLFFAKLCVPLALAVIVLNSGISKACDSLPFNIDTEKEFTIAHFLMLGLNYESGGIYNGEDMAFSLGYNTAQERKEANLKETKKRLSEFTPAAFAEHITRKTVSNYANGVFGWGQEGASTFFKTTYEDKLPGISSFFKNCFYHHKDFYKIFALTKQIVWFFVLILCVFSLSKRNKCDSKFLLTIALSIIGLTLFETIFEARARYLYTYAPFYIMLASAGLRTLTGNIRVPANNR